uniref:CCHC-type domain-containing protein n=1 Tax=Nicotiana tabacum TaxID=4097 RepID=A0A1S4A1L4_TOBAC|nr:PREDICTED: uncharacterized protein LOC107792736 [Nicotiana tabacum]
MVRRNRGIPKRGSSNRPKNYDLCHKCGKSRHFIKDCPLLKQEHFKYNPDKVSKRNPVLDKHFKRKRSADNVVKQALTAWGDSSSESENETDVGDSFMMAVESEENEYDSIFSLMAQSDNDEVVLTKKIASVEHERDNLMVVVVDLKETIENFSNEKNYLVEKTDTLEQERDDLLVVIIDLKEKIEELKAECMPGKTDKGKGVASEEHIKLENELNAIKISLCVELEKTIQLQADLERVKNDLEKSLKWTWSLKDITAMYVNNGGNSGDLCCLKAVDDYVELRHRRLGHASFSLLNKLVQKDPVRGLPKSKFMEHKVCDAYARGKHVKSSFKPKKDKSNKGDQDGEPLLVPGEVIDMENGKADMMSQVNEPSEDNAVSSAGEEPGTTITTTEAKERVADAVQSATQVAERRMQENQSDLPSSSTNEVQVPNWKHKSSHPLDNIITPLDSGVQTRSKAINSLTFSVFLSQIEPKNIKEALKDVE